MRTKAHRGVNIELCGLQMLAVLGTEGRRYGKGEASILENTVIFRMTDHSFIYLAVYNLSSVTSSYI